MNYALELLKSEQRKLAKMLKTWKSLSKEGYQWNYLIDVSKYEKQLSDVNLAIEKIES